MPLDISRYRLIDLSKKIQPGVLALDGTYLHGSENRRLEARQFLYRPDGMVMHWVETETHIGTHVEGPTHHPKGRTDLASMPLDTFIGEAAVLRFDDLAPIDGRPRPIEPSMLQAVRKNDIVLMWSPFDEESCPYISPESARYLAGLPVKMVGIQGVGLEAPGSLESHEQFLVKGIPIIEGLTNLEQVKKDRVFYIGLPIRIAALDSSWVRAVVLEEK